MRVLGFLLIVVVVLMGIHNGGDLGTFIDPGAMLILLGALLGGLLMSGGTQTCSAIGVAFSGETSPDGLKTSARVLRATRLCIVAAVFFAIVAATITLLKDGDVRASGPALALILTGLFWGLLLAYFIVLPLESGVERRLLEGGHIEGVSGCTAVDLLVVGSIFLVAIGHMIFLAPAIGK